MKDEIHGAIDILVTMCSRLEEENVEISEKNKTTLTQYLGKDFKPELERCQRVVTSGTTSDVTTLAREIRNGEPNVLPSLKDFQEVDFQPGKISTELLKRMLSKLLVNGIHESYKPIPNCEVLHEFKTSFPYDTCSTTCLTGDEVWLSHWDGEIISRMDSHGNVKERIECQVKVSSTSVSPTTGRVWFCVTSDNSIREVTTGNNIVTRFKVDSTPGYLCITSDDKVVVGMRGGIELYSTDGRAVKSRTGNSCKHVADRPYHTTSCTLTGDVAAVDHYGVSFMTTWPVRNQTNNHTSS